MFDHERVRRIAFAVVFAVSTFVFHILYAVGVAAPHSGLLETTVVSLVHTTGVSAAVVWGGKLLDGEWRALTPQRATLAPVAIFAIAFVSLYFFDAPGLYYSSSRGSTTIVDTVELVIYSFSGACTIAAGFLLIGSAVSQQRNRLAVVASGVVLVAMLYMSETSVVTVYPTRVFVYGLPSFFLGYNSSRTV